MLKQKDTYRIYGLKSLRSLKSLKGLKSLKSWLFVSCSLDIGYFQAVNHV